MKLLCGILFTFVAVGHVSVQSAIAAQCASASALTKCGLPTDCSSLVTYTSCITSAYSQCGGIGSSLQASMDGIMKVLNCAGTSGNGNTGGNTGENCASEGMKCTPGTDCSSFATYTGCMTRAYSKCAGFGSSLQSYQDGLVSALKCTVTSGNGITGGHTGGTTGGNCASESMKCTPGTSCSSLVTYLSCMTSAYSQCGGFGSSMQSYLDGVVSALNCDGTSGNGNTVGNCVSDSMKCKPGTDCSGLNAYIDCYTKACGGVSQIQGTIDAIKTSLKCVGSNVMPSSFMLAMIAVLFFLTRL